MAAKATSVKAMASVALAVLSVGVWAFTELPPLAVAPVAVAGVALAVFGLMDIRRNQGMLKGEGFAIGGILTAVDGMLLFLLLLPAVQKVRDDARRMLSTGNLKHMAVAMHAYNEVHGRLPPHAVYGKDGRPLLSWRVLLLPFLEQETLFKKFRLEESWDSPHNIALLPEMPRIYGRYDNRTTTEPYTTFYQVFVGKGAAFEGTKGLKLADDFPDGIGQTILMVEAGEAVPWTKPDDLPYAADRPLPALGGLFKATIRAALVDGSVHSFKRETSEQTIHAAVTRNGGDALGPDW